MRPELLQDARRLIELLIAEKDKYKAALEEINKLPGGVTVRELTEIRFKAVNIAFKALVQSDEERQEGK